MRTLSFAVIVSAIGLALAFAAPAEAAKSTKQKKATTAHSMNHRHAAVAVGGGLQGGVRAGPLYNGQDYIGDDPDPNIRAYLIRDMTRYRGSF